MALSQNGTNREFFLCLEWMNVMKKGRIYLNFMGSFLPLFCHAFFSLFEDSSSSNSNLICCILIEYGPTLLVSETCFVGNENSV